MREIHRNASFARCLVVFAKTTLQLRKQQGSLGYRGLFEGRGGVLWKSGGSMVLPSRAFSFSFCIEILDTRGFKGVLFGGSKGLKGFQQAPPLKPLASLFS